MPLKIRLDLFNEFPRTLTDLFIDMIILNLKLIYHPDLKRRIAIYPMQKYIKFFVSCVTQEPKLRPTMQCHVGLYFLSNSFLIKAAMSLNKISDFFDVEFLQSLVSTVNSVLLHFFGHVCVFHYSLAISHLKLSIIKLILVKISVSNLI